MSGELPRDALELGEHLPLDDLLHLSAHERRVIRAEEPVAHGPHRAHGAPPLREREDPELGDELAAAPAGRMRFQSRSARSSAVSRR